MADLTLAVSESAFRRSFEVLRDSFKFEASDDADFGPFRVGYDVKAHLEGGDLDLRDDNTVQISELDLRWDKLQVSLGLDIPELCVGGGCINLPWPLPDICLPRICVFDSDPDVSISPDFAAFVAQEFSFTGSLDVRQFDASVPLPLPDLCAPLRIAPIATEDQWQLFLVPQTMDIDLFDFPDIIGDLIEDALSAAITAIIPGGWVRDLILAIIGGVTDLIRAILDIADDIEEWLSDIFNVSFGLMDVLATVASQFFASCNPIYVIPDPLEIMAPENGLVPVRIPIDDLSVRVDDDEMIVQADIGG